MEVDSLMGKREKRESWKKPVAVVAALLLVAGVIGAAVMVNKNAPMEINGLDAEMGDVVAPLVTGDTAQVPATDETVVDEPEGEFVLANDDEPAKEGEEVETVLADDTMKDGDKWEEDVAELDGDDEEGEKDFKAGKDILAKEDSRRTCRCVRYRAIYRRRCRRRCFRKRYRVCGWKRYRRCHRRRYRVRRSSDDYSYRYRTHCRYYRRRVCGWKHRRYCRNYCRRYRAGRRCVRRVCRSASA